MSATDDNVSDLFAERLLREGAAMMEQVGERGHEQIGDINFPEGDGWLRDSHGIGASPERWVEIAEARMGELLALGRLLTALVDELRELADTRRDPTTDYEEGARDAYDDAVSRIRAAKLRFFTRDSSTEGKSDNRKDSDG